MSRKDYELIAKVIKSIAYDEALTNLSQVSTLRILAERMALSFSHANDSFNGDKFVSACGFPDGMIPRNLIEKA